MTFFQNLFNDYESSWGAGDEHGYSLNSIKSSFKINGNKNSPEVYAAWNEGPYDLSADGDLTINFSLFPSFNDYYSIVVDVSGSTASATTPLEIVEALNADSSFSERFTADLTSNSTNLSNQKVAIVPKKPVTALHFYIPNIGAENVLRFNKQAGVADIPSFFEKDTIENRFNQFSLGQLVRLSHPIESNSVDTETEITSTDHGLSNGDIVYIVGSNSTPSIDGQHEITVVDGDTFSIEVNVTTAGSSGEWLSELEKTIVEEAGLDYSDMLLDWEHLRGEAKSYFFTKNTFDGSDRITEQIIWPTGAKAGQTAKKVINTYTGTATSPTTVVEIPYILQESDLFTP